MRVLGIDPGYDRVGWAVLDADVRKNCRVIAYDCIQTKKTSTFVQRYSQISAMLKHILAVYSPQVVSIESIFFSNNQKTAIRVSEARGVIIASILPYLSDMFEYTPNQIKLAVTGHGNADKQAVEKMVRMQLKLSIDKTLDDTIDAVAAAFAHVLLRETP